MNMLHAHNCSSAKAFSPASRSKHVPTRVVSASRQLKVESIVQDRAGISQDLSGVVSDEAVPEGHKGLHNFLYSEKADEHSAHVYEHRQDEDNGEQLLSVSAYLAARDSEKPVGVYALYDEEKALQYVSYSRNMVLAIKAHLARVGLTRCAYVRPMVFRNRAMTTRANLENQVAAWISEAGSPPPGNTTARGEWEGTEGAATQAGSVSAPTAIMSAAELAEYEEKKLKMRKAMGENLHDAPKDEEISARDRRLNMIAAVHGDNWSAVISDQTERTLAAAMPRPTPAPPTTAGPIASPFSQATVHRSIGAASAAPVEMSVASVTAALEEVRPYLLADGGDVAVLEVRDGTVLLELQGACTTCPSSSATMKMGIERSLKAKFGDALKEVMQVASASSPPKATADTVDLHLNTIRGAIVGLGGSVDVVSVEGGVATLRYKGPAPLGKGVQAAVKDKFRDIKEVVLTS